MCDIPFSPVGVARFLLSPTRAATSCASSFSECRLHGLERTYNGRKSKQIMETLTCAYVRAASLDDDHSRIAEVAHGAEEVEVQERARVFAITHRRVARNAEAPICSCIRTTRHRERILCRQDWQKMQNDSYTERIDESCLED